MNTSINIKHATDIIVKSIKAWEKLGRQTHPIVLEGSPGLGKSAIWEQIANRLGYQFEVSQPALDEPADYKGIPYIVEGFADFFAPARLRLMCEATQPILWLFDDLGHTPRGVQAALMHLVHAREIGGRKISDNVFFAFATNSKKDKAGVNPIISPLADRLTKLEVHADIKSWSTWAMEAGFKPEDIAFLRFKPECLDNLKPNTDFIKGGTPRSWTNVFQYTKAGIVDELLIAGDVGMANASEYMAFQALLRELPNIDAMFLNPEGAQIPTKPSILFALSGAIVSRAEVANLDVVLKLVNRIPKDFQVWVMKDIATRIPEAQSTTSFLNWFMDNQDVVL